MNDLFSQNPDLFHALIWTGGIALYVLANLFPRGILPIITIFVLIHYAGASDGLWMLCLLLFTFGFAFDITRYITMPKEEEKNNCTK